MIPYFEVPAVRLGPLLIAPYGALVATGVLAGLGVCFVRARPLGLSVRDAFDAFWWAVMGGVLGAHLLEVVAYRPDLLATRGWRALIDLGGGFSSFGAFFGGIGVLLLRLRLGGKPSAPYLDLVMECLVVGWIIGRLGCVFAHDHPRASGAWLDRGERKVVAFPVMSAYAVLLVAQCLGLAALLSQLAGVQGCP